MIPYKEYTACREAQRRVLTTSKSTSGKEENWDEEPPLPPQEAPPGGKSVVPSQEDEWKLMVNQDPCSGLVAGDSGHGTMAATGEDKPIDSTEELVGAVGGVDESVAIEHDVEWRHDDPLCSMMFPCSNHPLGKSLASENRSPNIYQRQLQHTSNLTITMQNQSGILGCHW